MNRQVGLSKKISEAVEHSKVVLDRRMRKAHSMFLRKAFEGWLMVKYGGKTSREKMLKVMRRMTRYKVAKVQSRAHSHTVTQSRD